MRLSDNVDSPVKPLFNHGGRSVVKVTRDPICIGTAHTTITVKVDQLPDDCHMTEDVASSWRAILSGDATLSFTCTHCISVHPFCTGVIYHYGYRYHHHSVIIILIIIIPIIIPLTITMDYGYHYVELIDDAISAGTDSKPAVSGDLVSAAGDKNTVIARIPVSNLSSGQELKLTVEALVYFCHDSDGVCKRKCVLIEQLVKIQ